MKRFLVTTALEETWPDDQPVLFLGDWCRLYSRRDRWLSMSAEVLPYHWDNRDRFYADYQYLKGFYERVLSDLSTELNQIHGEEHSRRYWRILIGPWVAYFVHVLYDRWLSIQEAVNCFDITGTITITGNEDGLVPTDMGHMAELMCGDEWNHHIYATILVSGCNVPCVKKTCKIKTSIQKATDNVGLIRKMAAIYAGMASRFVRKNDAFLIATYLPFISEIRLCLRNRQIPQWWRTVQSVCPGVEWQQRQWRMPDHGESDFERFALTMIPRQIPSLLLEGYQQLVEQTRTLPWPKNPKVIFTSSALWQDTVHMAYTAEKVERDTPLVYGQHGGAYGVAKFHFAEEHEVAISDRYLTWGWGDESNPRIVPVGILRIDHGLRGSFNSKKKLLFVTYNVSRYSNGLSSESSINFQDYFLNCFSLASSLQASIQNQMLVRLSSTEYGWHHSARWRDRFPHIALEHGCSKIHDLMKKARLVVLTYNQTGFLETLALGIPSVLLCDLNISTLRDAAVPYYEDLKRVGIFHETPESAAAHVNQIWNDVDSWWTSALVQDVLARFRTQYCYRPNNLLDRVQSVLREAISESEFKESSVDTRK